MTPEEFAVVWEAVTQFVDNSQDEGDGPHPLLPVAEKLLDKLDAEALQRNR